MALDISRPSTQNGGSRPSTSRFVEGSMNDRVSAAPPPQFLGPNQLADYERQFYADPSIFSRGARGARLRRPFSESSVSDRTKAQQEHIITHRKSTGFFNRVRDALGWSSSRSSTCSNKQTVARKHSSLQEPLQHPSPPLSPPRSDHLRAAKSHSEMYNIPQLRNLSSGTSRPTRDEVLQSYNQLMATGFFQSHAIQSTRHANPATRGNDRYLAPPMPSIPGSGPCSPQPPPRISSINATRSYSPHSAIGVGSRARRVMSPEPEVQPRRVPDNKESHYAALRGRKRNIIDVEGVTNAEAPGASTSSSFVQPLKRVAKKLRQMPSLNKDVQMSDGVLRLPPSTSFGGTTYLRERAIRMRSPSPAPPEVSRRRTDQKQSRRTFSASSQGEGSRLRKRSKSTSLRSRNATAGFETWEMASERLSMEGNWEVIAPDTDAPDAAPLRSREHTPLSVVPDVNRGIPMVPRIPDQYHHYHKSRAFYQDESENMEVEWCFGKAL